MKVSMVSLGCPKNQMDAELMLANLHRAGHTITPDNGAADVVVVNTCGFVEEAKREAVETILELGMLKREGTIKGLVVTGCLAQRYREELVSQLPECNVILGLGANGDIVRAVETAFAGGSDHRFPGLDQWSLDGARIQSTPAYTAYLRIADGCDNRCAYCAIPLIRGPLRSRGIDALTAEAAALAESGVRELVLVAQDTTAFGIDISGRSLLPDLLRRLVEIDTLRWIRLLYCYPQHVSDELLVLMRNEPKIVRYLDLPLQHASGKILRAMNRTGDDVSLLRLIRHIRDMVPGIALRTTVMTGFPGENAEDFELLCRFIKEARFDRLGCFAFSAEEGTKASQLAGQVDPDVREARRDTIMLTQSIISEALDARTVGTNIEVLVEGYDRYAECWFGRSAADAPDIDNKVFFTCDDGVTVIPGDFVTVRIDGCMEYDRTGVCIA